MLALTLLLLAPAQIPVLSSRDLTSQMQISSISATVRIVNETRGTQGSGTIIGKRGPFVYILTAAHVVDGAEQSDVHLFTEKTYPKPTAVYRSVPVIRRQAEHDLALLRLLTRDRIGHTVAVCPPRLVPGAISFPVLSVGCNNGQAPTAVVEDLRGKKQFRLRSKESSLFWELGNPGVEGRSGGPLLDRRGYLLGVSSGTSNDRGYYVHIDRILAFLDQPGLKWLFGADLER